MRNGQEIANSKVFFIEKGDLKHEFIHDICANKNIVLVGIPGAYTPTCNKSHIPELYTQRKKIYAKNIDLIICIVVNDAFVIEGWKESLNIEDDKFMFLSDGNCEFAKISGLDVDLSVAGLGKRLKRFSCTLKNLIVNDLFVEDEIVKDKNTNATSILKRI